MGARDDLAAAVRAADELYRAALVLAAMPGPGDAEAEDLRRGRAMRQMDAARADLAAALRAINGFIQAGAAPCDQRPFLELLKGGAE